MKGVADYYIRDGNRIDIKPAAGASDDTISAFLTSSAFATLLQQRNMLTIHASGVLGARGATLFVGSSGIGKSTTMAAMLERGFSMVTDDVGAIEFDKDDAPIVRSSFAGGRLTARSLAMLGKPADAYRKFDSEIEKYAYPVELGRTARSLIDRIIILDVGDQPDVTLSELDRVESFQLLSRFTFRKRFYDGMEMQGFHFGAASKLVGAVPVMRALRPEHPFLLDELIDLIVAEIGQPTGDQVLT